MERDRCGLWIHERVDGWMVIVAGLRFYLVVPRWVLLVVISLAGSWLPL